MTVAETAFNLARPPETDEELYWLIYTLWDVKIPRTKVCADHSTPFDAFADAFFARSPVSVWKGSRGFGGKSRTLAYLTLTEAVIYGAEANLLGGSLAQSQNIQEAMRDGWEAPLAPRHMVVHDGSQILRLSNGAKVRPLTASQRTVRGPHPQRLRLDEIDEMDLSILDSAMGQPMPRVINGVYIDTQTVMSSTHQYPDKTMYEILQRARENDWPVHEWCWRETSNPIDGWLAPETVERKKREVSMEMFRVEYDLAEPSVGNRAFNTEKVEEMFSIGWPGKKYDMPNMKAGAFEDLCFEEPDPTGDYVTSADWAKEQDYTVICTWRTDCYPWRMVAYRRGNRKPWPVMVRWYNTQLSKYGGYAIHDGTGIGNVINDYIDSRSRAFIMSGQQRNNMLNEYVAAVERGDLRAPMVESAYVAHKYASVEAVFGGGDKNHLPDEICALALGWHLKGRKPLAVAPMGVPRYADRVEQEYRLDPGENEVPGQSPWKDIGGSKQPAPVSEVYRKNLDYDFVL